MPEQHALTVIAEVADSNVAPLRNLLHAVGQNIDADGNVPLASVQSLLPGGAPAPGGPNFIEFRKLSTVHFLRWVLLEPARDAQGNRIGASLAFSTDYDGPLDAHLDELLRIAEPALQAIYSFCDPAPPSGQLLGFLCSRSRPYEAFYRGHPGRSVQQIWGSANHSEDELRDILEAEFDPPPRPASAVDAVARARTATGHSGWRLAATAGPPLGVQWLALAKPFAVALALFFFLPWILFGFWIGAASLAAAILATAAALGVWGTLLNLLDRSDGCRECELLRQAGPPPDPDGSQDPYVAERRGARLREVSEMEDQQTFVQNQLTHVVNVKPGMLRLLWLRFVLCLIDWLAHTLFVKGKLGEIPTIHFARWVLIDDNRRLLFFSNYDFSWESYLGDFIDLASDGLTGVWSNTTFFPPTRFHGWTALPRALWLALRALPGLGSLRATLLFAQGAKRESDFKKWTRDHQVPTQVWYSAYPSLSVVNVNNNTEIATGLFAPLTGAEQQVWLRRL